MVEVGAAHDSASPATQSLPMAVSDLTNAWADGEADTDKLRVLQENLEHAINTTPAPDVPLTERQAAYQVLARAKMISAIRGLPNGAKDTLAQAGNTINELETELSAACTATATGLATETVHGPVAAVPIFESAMDGFAKSLGKDSADYLNVAHMALNCAHRTGNGAEIQRLYRTIFNGIDEVRIALRGDVGAQLCVMYAWHVYSVGKDHRRARELAEPALERLAALSDAEFSATRTDFAVTKRYALALVAASYASLDTPADRAEAILNGRLDQAREVGRRAFEQLANTVGPDHQLTQQFAQVQMVCAAARIRLTGARIWNDRRHEFLTDAATQQGRA
ncbi:hypothetical protein FHT44_006289 [Mycolicibacterium sp. BK634]|uniref:hypothetical protein n=1 Tax=Mycolicibacterium sp. BK634 TaxID=2587099 RepID=UPI00161DB07C|nr:hypothetical protein [Mycolicibacterium sp. BK634]MBB3753767.1 hypothetical protein [Mycolicibacterium sp. BK634]